MRKVAVLILVFILASKAIAKPNGTRPLMKADDPWLGTDKLRHFLASAVATGMLKHQLRYQVGCTSRQSQSLSASLVFSLGLAKEVRDLWHPKGSASWKDLLADGLGTGLGLLLP